MEKNTLRGREGKGEGKDKAEEKEKAAHTKPKTREICSDVPILATNCRSRARTHSRCARIHAEDVKRRRISSFLRALATYCGRAAQTHARCARVSTQSILKRANSL